MMSREQLEACPNFSEHGLIQGCGLCDPTLLPPISDEQIAEVNAALRLTGGRHEAEQLRLLNDATVQRLATQGLQINPLDIVSMHLAVLLDTVLGDMDAAPRQAYEIALHTRMAAILADVGAQAARAKLTQGINGIDPSKLPRRPR